MTYQRLQKKTPTSQLEKQDIKAALKRIERWNEWEQHGGEDEEVQRKSNRRSRGRKYKEQRKNTEENSGTKGDDISLPSPQETEQVAGSKI